MSFFDNLGVKLSDAKKAFYERLQSNSVLRTIPHMQYWIRNRVGSIGLQNSLNSLTNSYKGTQLLPGVKFRLSDYTFSYMHIVIEHNYAIVKCGIQCKYRLQDKLFPSPLNDSVLETYMQISRGNGFLSNAYMLSMPFEISFFTFVVV